MSAKNPIPNPLCTQQNGSIAGENLGLMKPCSLRFSSFEQAFVYIWITTQASPLLQISFWFSVDSVQELASTSFILLEWFHPSTLHMIQWKKKKKKKQFNPPVFIQPVTCFVHVNWKNITFVWSPHLFHAKRHALIPLRGNQESYCSCPLEERRDKMLVLE